MIKQKVIFDTETTGLNPLQDEIIQFSAVNEKGEVLLDTYVKPKHRVRWDQAQAVNGISPEKVKDCPTMDELREQIQQIFSTASELIAYNGAFDECFLKAAGINFPDVPRYDVMKRFAEIYGEWNDYYGEYKWQKLSACAAYYGYSFKAHDSLEDVMATLYCYKKMKGEE